MKKTGRSCGRSLQDRAMSQHVESKKMDRRVRRTRGNLRASLTRLIQQKPINEITVKEISDGADINRATFYLHYKDTYDMLCAIESEIFEEVSQIANAHTLGEFADDPIAVLTDVFEFVETNADLCRALLSKNGDMMFIESLKRFIQEKCYADWRALAAQREVNNFTEYYMFIVSGTIGLIQYWLDSGMKKSSAEMAALARAIIASGLTAIDRG